jgi:hypothetical protein
VLRPSEAFVLCFRGTQLVLRSNVLTVIFDLKWGCQLEVIQKRVIEWGLGGGRRQIGFIVVWWLY